MSDELRYHPLIELKHLSLDELHALWELVPTERQRSYRAAYERELKTAKAEGSDERERLVARELIRRYAQAKLVPLGLRWARAPVSVQESARANRGLEPEAAPITAGKPSATIIAAFGALIALMLGVLVFRGASSGPSADATPNHAATQTALPSTPLALEAQDSVIAGGDSGRDTFYPVNLQITLPDDPTPPRVWVVQRRTIRASQWYYDADPDTASYLSGMAVRPVVGIPWSAENAAWFARIGDGTAFNVQMNTGAILRYEFDAREEVRRSDTGIFRQVSPGLVLLLLGETDADGLPTATRTLILARYSVDQELARGGALVGAFALPTIQPTPTATPTPQPFAGLHVDLYRVTYGNGQITTYLHLYNGGTQPMTISPDDITLTLGYSENPVGVPVPAEGMQSLPLQAKQGAHLQLMWFWNEEELALLSVADFTFVIAL